MFSLYSQYNISQISILAFPQNFMRNITNKTYSFTTQYKITRYFKMLLRNTSSKFNLKGKKYILFQPFWKHVIQTRVQLFSFFGVEGKLILFPGKHICSKRKQLILAPLPYSFFHVIPSRGFHTNLPANKPFENISKETCSPWSLSDFYRPDVGTAYNETINNDTFLLLATTKPANKKPVHDKNSAFVLDFLYWNIALLRVLDTYGKHLAAMEGSSGDSMHQDRQILCCKRKHECLRSKNT